jgi:hypothetical protein
VNEFKMDVSALTRTALENTIECYHLDKVRKELKREGKVEESKKEEEGKEKEN